MSNIRNIELPVENFQNHYNKITHYKRSPENHFLISEVQTTTILLGGLSSLADEFITNSLLGLGYKAKALPVPNMESMSKGKEYCDTGLCNPTYFTIGNLILFLEHLRESGLSKDEIISHYIFATAGSCGPCRFGMYEYEYRYALENAGFAGFRVIVFQMAGALNQDDQISGLRLDFEFFRAILNSVILSDHLNDLKNQIKPYEIERGSTEKAIAECSALISEYLRTKKPIGKTVYDTDQRKIKFEVLKNLYDQFLSRDLEKILKKCKKIISRVKVDYQRIKPVIKITGEFWAQSTEGDGNYRIFEFLENEGCEIIVEPVSSWVTYLIWLEKIIFNEKSMSDKNGRIRVTTPIKYTRALLKKISKNLYYDAGTILFRVQYNRIGRSLGDRFRPLKSVSGLAKLAKKYMNVKYDGGEGFLEVAKNIYFTKNHMAHMVLSVKPFGCMPSTISDSIQSKVVSQFENMVFLPLETSGEGKINALSRVQMALGEAREKAIKEYEMAMDKLGLKIDRNTLKTVQPKSATDKIPKYSGSALRAVAYLFHMHDIR